MRLKNSATRWGLISIAFHWTMAGLFFGQFWLGWYMLGIDNRLAEADLLWWHKSVGFLLLALLAFRLAWVVVQGRPTLPITIHPGERRLARLSHLFTYFLLFLLPLSGWAIVSSNPLMRSTPVFGVFTMPPLALPSSLYGQQIWTSIHGLFAYTMLFLSAVHALAALRHHFHHKDGVLLNMLGWQPNGTPGVSGKSDQP